MGQITVNVGSFDKSSSNGVTAYGTTMYFTIPENAGITGCSVTFVTHNSGGHTQDRAFYLNGLRAHSSGSWANAGALDHTLLSAGSNAFRVQLKSQAGAACWWSISGITLTITYNDVGGGGTPPPNIGAVTINKTSLTAGDTITVSASACDALYNRSIYLMLADNTVISVIEYNFGTAAGSWTVTVPTSLCETYASDSETLIIKAYMEVYQTGTYVGSDAKNFTMQVPASAVPSIGAFTATRNANGVDASITNYVQNYSKVALAISGESGALGSSIVSYEITGGGKSAATKTTTFGPFSQTGNITFTAKVTDSRGRTGTKAVTINVLPYTPVSGVNLLAYRSDGSMGADDEGAYATLRGRRVFSSLDGQNSAVISGRVYEKDTTPGGWTAMSDDTLLLLGGSMSIEKGYTAEIAVNDKITAVVYVFQIPTAIVGIHITPGATGGGFGMYGQAGRWEFSAPIYSPEGACPGVNDFLFTLNSTSPAVRFPGTTWSAIGGRFLIGADGVYIAGAIGGAESHQQEIPIYRESNAEGVYFTPWNSYGYGAGGAVTVPYFAYGTVVPTGTPGSKVAYPLLTSAASNIPPYLAVYIWKRTA